jgi:hypothetical protein
VPYVVKSRLFWRRDQGEWLARRPESFAGKVRWKMLKDRRLLLTTFADKVAARRYVGRVVGADCLTECHAVASDPRDLDRQALPREFVAKVSHSYNAMWIVSDAADRPASPSDHPRVMITRPDALDWNLFDETFRKWLRPSPASAEWAYKDIPPRLIVEELLRGRNGEIPPDYKFYVFDGRVRLVHMDIDRFTAHRRRVYLPDWTPLDVVTVWLPDPTTPVFPLAPVTPPPEALSRMIEIAEALGQETDFVRVDLYDIDGRVVFGELTNYPDAGGSGFAPAAFDLEVGSWWTLPPRYSPRYFRRLGRRD